MCGIVAMFSRGEPVSRDALTAAVKILHHRGPDGQRQWISPDGRVGLGHARLSIIDLETGDQPIASEDDQLHIVVNGEFYDYVGLQQELESRGHKLRTRSDSEVALHLYEEIGTKCLSRLRGEFAMVLWDASNQMLIAARDRYGVKPLYYAWRGDTLLLASEIKALLAAGVPARWDHESFYQYNHVQFDQDRTLFAGIYQVPPGCYLLVTRGQSQIVRYWDINYPRDEAPTKPLHPQEHIERMRAALEESVRTRLRADVPVGCYLSGGLDSCALLGLASLHHPEPIKAFTLCFDAEDYNEEHVAREMAQHAGADFHELPITQTQLADHFSDAVWHAETLTANGHGTAKYLLSEMVRDRGYKVVLTGEGSDEILGGYAHFRRDLLLYDKSLGLDAAQIERMLEQLTEANEVSRGVLLPNRGSEPLDSIRRTLGFVPSWLETRASNAERYRRIFRADFAAEFAPCDPFRVFLNRFDVDGQLTGRAAVHQSLYLWTRSMLPNYLLNFLGDRMEMAHSIEGRVPFLDHHVTEAVRDMPVSMKIHLDPTTGSLTEKYVLREACRDVLTDTVYRRQKHPFLAPPSGLDPEGRFSQLMQDTLRSRALDDLPFYEPTLVRALLDALPTLEPRKRGGASYLLTLILSACVLQQRYALG